MTKNSKAARTLWAPIVSPASLRPRQYKGRRLLAFVVVFILQQQLAAQNRFTHKSTLGIADSTSLYRLPLSPLMLAKSGGTAAGIRIVDHDGKEAPFVMDSNQYAARLKLEAFSIRSKSFHPDKKMHVTVQTIGGLVRNLLLRIQNTDASRTVDISGSRNEKDWFIIKEQVPVSKSPGKDGSYELTVELAPVDYPFLDIAFNNKDLLPANILSAGTLKPVGTTLVAYDTLRSIQVIQKDSSNKISYIKVIFEEAYPFEKIKLNLAGPPFFRRQVETGAGLAAGSFVLDATDSSWIKAGTRQALLTFSIDNEDNQPLHVMSVDGIIEKRSIFAWLEKGKSYEMLLGDSNTAVPRYDLVYFKNLIQNNAPVMVPQRPTKYKVAATATPANNKFWLWLAIAAGLGILLFVTVKLAREVGKNDTLG